MTAAVGYRPPACHRNFSEPSCMDYRDTTFSFARSSVRREASACPSLGSGTRYRCEQRKRLRSESPDGASIHSVDIRIDTGAARPPPPPPQHPQPIKEYGDQWEWDPDFQDYVRVDENGNTLLYTNYQRPNAKYSPSSSQDLIRRTLRPPAPDRPTYDAFLPQGFQAVAKPKRFFSIGRIFKAVWFEPSQLSSPSPPTTTTRRQQPGEQWSATCEPFHGARPVARFRWFVVVRRRAQHTLCFNITTFSGRRRGGGGGGVRSNHNSNKKNTTASAATPPAAAATNTSSRTGGGGGGGGGGSDHVVLHSAAVEPPRPYDEEGITRDPIAVIIEDEEQYISPVARLDCGRVYTVEDGLATFKIGRVHPDYLPLLEQYYRESMLR
ncbi:hypothetical protein VTK26DRAFT_1883 [Humicola hyalothermophila]